MRYATIAVVAVAVGFCSSGLSFHGHDVVVIAVYLGS